VCYQTGTGVDQDRAEAARLYRLAAGQGQKDAVATVARLGL
jgi:TPR repeat protein